METLLSEIPRAEVSWMILESQEKILLNTTNLEEVISTIVY